MKFTKKPIAIMLSTVSLLTASLSLTACDGHKDPEPPPVESRYEFEFKGVSSDFEGGRTLNVTIYGNKDAEKTVALRVEEYPQILIEGNYVYVEGKGYKIYFKDATSAYVYSQFDDSTDTFSFNYTLDVGSLGSARMKFTYTDTSFVYDGEGLGRTPPTFIGTGSGVGSDTVQLICNEDGTFTSTPVTNKYGGTRTGTWEYDKNSDRYLLHFDVDTKYNQAFTLNEADASGHYCGYNKVTDGSTQGEWQICFPGTDPLCIDITTGDAISSGLPINEPYKSAARYDPETGRVDIKFSELDNLEELVAANCTGNTDYANYAVLPDIYYYIVEDGVFDILNDQVAEYDEETGVYNLIWETSLGKYSIITGSYDPN